MHMRDNVIAVEKVSKRAVCIFCCDILTVDHGCCVVSCLAYLSCLSINHASLFLKRLFILFRYFTLVGSVVG